MNQCAATRANGEPCNARALPSRPMCWAHDAGSREKATEARRRGGENKANARRAAKHIPADMKALASQLMAAISEVYAGELEPKRLTAMASGAGATVRVHEVGELEARLEELERRAEGGPGRRAW